MQQSASSTDMGTYVMKADCAHHYSRHSPTATRTVTDACLVLPSIMLASSTDRGAYIIKLTVQIAILATHQQRPGL